MIDVCTAIVSEYVGTFGDDYGSIARPKSYAKRILSMFPPNVIISVTSDNIYNYMVDEGMILVGYSISKTRSRNIGYIRHFQDYLVRIFNSHTHPEWFGVIV